jgi:hypothetical protein
VWVFQLCSFSVTFGILGLHVIPYESEDKFSISAKDYIECINYLGYIAILSKY